MMLKHKLPILALLSLLMLSAFAVIPGKKLEFDLKVERWNDGEDSKVISNPILNLRALDQNKNSAFFNNVYQAAMNDARRVLSASPRLGSFSISGRIGFESPSAESAVSETVDIPEDLFDSDGSPERTFSSPSIARDQPSSSSVGDVQASSLLPTGWSKEHQIRFRQFFFKNMIQMGRSTTPPFIRNGGSFTEDEDLSIMARNDALWEFIWGHFSRYFNLYFPEMLNSRQVELISRTAGYGRQIQT